MANTCSFQIRAKGSSDGLKKFVKAMVGRGAWLCFYECRGPVESVEGNKELDGVFSNGFFEADGECKWSVKFALIDNADSMAEQKKTGSGMWCTGDEFVEKDQFKSLWTCAEEYGVEFELYSEEIGFEFQEHFAYVDGQRTEECVKYAEYCLEEYHTREEAQAELNIPISVEDWEEGYVHVGGFDDWDFKLIGEATGNA